VITLDTQGFSILTASGVQLFRHHWPDEGAPAAEALADAFGILPTVTHDEGDGSHIAPADFYSWEGVRFRNTTELEKPRDGYSLSTALDVTTPSLGGVRIEAPGGIAVGNTRDEALAARAEPDEIIAPETLLTYPGVPIAEGSDKARWGIDLMFDGQPTVQSIVIPASRL
jgi:hypothetical protein